MAATICVAIAITGFIVWWAGWLSPRNTLPGRITDYHKIYDLWDVACDTAPDGSDKRCYLQYVDAYRPNPDFAAAMVEVVFHKGTDGKPDPHIRFDIEPGLSFQKTKVNVETGGGQVPLDVSNCATNTCRFNGDTARALLKSWRDAKLLRFEIDEGRPAPAKLAWKLGNMAAILDEFAKQRRARGLP